MAEIKEGINPTEAIDEDPELEEIKQMTAEERQVEFNRLGEEIDRPSPGTDVSALKKRREKIWQIMEEIDKSKTRLGE